MESLLDSQPRGWLVASGAQHPGIWCNTFARLDPIAGGALLAVYTHKHTVQLSYTLRLILFMSGVIALCILGRYGDFVGGKALMTFPVATLACVTLLTATIDAQPLRSQSRLVAVAAYLGRISYGLYVFALLKPRLYPLFSPVRSDCARVWAAISVRSTFVVDKRPTETTTISSSFATTLTS
jgi:peptidoglycan/LPS O-acetylase OafA/YrhL